ncbi:BACON domain-containing protein [Rugamonas apoptosis]|uniref:Quinoprotein amine dehydrogenase n=1 Tax=Rugamonas apoptosis TaxID=2758570 RepID=A0A7W2IL92_9BURK|nr:quinoprotein amine dehydrogenase [Rugamonas apoptosis]MBA5688232.1 quinoprotein amine dehydrogenase [Rugamonas apoptosis]
MHRYWSALTLASLLTACGGGGGTTDGTPVPAASAALSFSPDKVAISAVAGTSTTATVTATVARPADFGGATVYAYLVDGAGVLLPNVQLVADGSQAYHATLQTAPTLAAGGYQGNFTVKLCRDSGCAGQFPGSPMLLPYDIQVAPAGSAPFSASGTVPLTVTMHQGGAVPAPAAISVQAVGRSWSAVSGAAWLTLNNTSGSGNATITATYAAASLAPGLYNTTVTLTAGDGLVATVPVALTVLAPAFQVSSDGVTFTAINGAPIAAQDVQLATDNAQATRWIASSGAGWLRASPSQGYTPATTTLSIDPTIGTLVSGNYSTNLTLTATGVTTRQLPVALKLVRPTLLVSNAAVTLGGSYGRDFSPRSMTLSLNTGANLWPWQLSAAPAWASASAFAGRVGATASTITFTPNAAAAPASGATVQMLAGATVNGDVVATPITLTINKDKHKLLPSELGVAMSGTPGWSRVTRRISMVDNYGLVPDWTAASDQPWLTASGSGASLILSADPSALAPNSLNYATVTVAPTDPAIPAATPIRVAFWKGTTTPTAPVSPHPLYRNVVTDPIRPLVYAHNGGTTIDIYNVYTGQLTDTLTGFGGALGDMAVSADGALLYAYDLDNSKLEVRVLATKAVQARWTLAHKPDRTSRLALLRPNGVDLVALNDGSIYNSAGKLLASLPIQGGTLSAAADGKRLYVQDEDGTAVHLATYTVDYADIGGGPLFTAPLPAASHLGNGGAGQDIAVSADGAILYAASASPTQCSVLGTNDLGTLSYLASGGNAPDNVEVGSDGRVYCGVAGKSAAADVWVYSAAGALLQQRKFVPVGRQLAPRQMVISGDGFILIGLNDDGVLNIVPVGP